MSTGENLTITACARLLGVTESDLSRWNRAGIGPPSISAGATIRYRRSAVEEWKETTAAAIPLELIEKLEEVTGMKRNLLTAREVSEMCDVPPSTLHEWAVKRDAGLPSPGPVHVQLSARHRRWREQDVMAWIEGARRD